MIMSRTKIAFLPKHNFNHNTNRKVVYIRWIYGVIGLTHGYDRHGAESICHLLTHPCWGGDLGTVMVCVLIQYKLLSGRGTIILVDMLIRSANKPRSNSHIFKWNQLGVGWYQSIIMFLIMITDSINVRDLWTPTLARTFDNIIMAAFFKVIPMLKSQWTEVNPVCL
jgi:hypothetical protein